MITIADILVKMKKDLDWRGPGGHPQGHVVLTREEAAYLHDHVIELINERDKLVRDVDDLCKGLTEIAEDKES